MITNQNARLEGEKQVRDVLSTASDAAGRGMLTVLDATEKPTTLAWDGVDAYARRMATILSRLDVGRVTRVGLLAETSVDLVVAVRASWLAGASVTMLAPPMQRVDGGYLNRLRRLLEQAGMGLLIVGDNLGEIAPVLRGSVPIVLLSDLVRQAGTATPMTPCPPVLDDLAVLQYTSGSTSEPRAVPVTHRHLAANICGIVAATGHRPDVRLFSWLPLYHDMGLIGTLALSMSTGCSLILQSPGSFLVRPASWLEGVARYRATRTVAPAFAFAMAARSLAGRSGPELDLSCLELAVCGAEPISAATMETFVAAAGRYGLRGESIVCAYGLAEATLAVTFSTPGAGLRVDTIDARAEELAGYALPAGGHGRGRRLVRLGTPVDGTGVRILDTAGTPLDERRIGEVEVRGPAVVGHYWGQPPPASGSWLRTGDLGYLTGGELVICGRTKDVLFAAGRNIFPQDIEWAAASVPQVRGGNVAAFGVPHQETDRRQTGRPELMVVAVESRDSDHESVREAVISAVVAGAGLRPTEVVVLTPGRLPKTSSGKLRRSETRDRYLAGTLTGPVKER